MEKPFLTPAGRLLAVLALVACGLAAQAATVEDATSVTVTTQPMNSGSGSGTSTGSVDVHTTPPEPMPMTAPPAPPPPEAPAPPAAPEFAPSVPLPVPLIIIPPPHDNGARPAPMSSLQPAPRDDGTLPPDLWDRVREGFAITSIPDDPLVYRHIAWFAARPDYVERTVERSRRYLYFIVDEVERRGMPTEIALLPIVESAFNPHALSATQASGIWQFMPSTGRLFGLQQNWWYDGRRDVVAATYSALDYLQRLYDEFGAWDLALAAYNCGDGKLRREIAFNRAHGLPADFAHLRLPDQTRNYIPRLLAARAIVMNPEKYGLILPSIPDEPYFSVITTTKRLDTKVAARFAEMSQDDFLMLNPGFNRPVITLSRGAQQHILVPVAVADRFIQRLQDPQVTLVTWKTRQLHKGEHLERVASQYGMSSEELKRINGISSNRMVAGGGVILVPDQSGQSAAGLQDLKGKPESEIPDPHVRKHHKSRKSSHARVASRHHSSGHARSAPSRKKTTRTTKASNHDSDT